MTKRKTTGVLVLALLIVVALVMILVTFLGEDDRSGLKTAPEGVARNEIESVTIPRRRAPLLGDAATARQTSEETEKAPADPATRGPVIAGRILGPDGNEVPWTNLGLFRFNGEPVGRAILTGRCGDDGSFTLPATEVEAGQYLLVAHFRTLRPASLQLEIDGLGSRENLELVLGRGFEIVGQVRSRGRSVTVGVAADLAFGTPGLFGMKEELFWKDGRVEAKHASAGGDHQGRFRLRGLGPHVHDFFVNLPGGALGLSESKTRLKVRAPEADLQIELDLATMDIEVQGGGSRVDWARVAVIAIEEGGELHGELHLGRWQLPVASGTSLRIDVAAPGWLPKSVEVRSPPGGIKFEVPIVLDPAPERALVLDFSPEDRRRLAGLHVKLKPLSAEESGAGRGNQVLGQFREHRFHFGDDLNQPIRWSPLVTEPARYRLEAHPYWPAESSRSRFHFIPAPEIVLPTKGDLRVSLEIVEGGELVVAQKHAVDDHFSGREVIWKLLDATGRRVTDSTPEDGQILVEAQKGGGDGPGLLISDANQRVTRLLRPGRHEFLVLEGRREILRRAIRIEAGKKVVIDLFGELRLPFPK